MNTEQYIHQFLMQHKADAEVMRLPLVEWIYSHPTIIKTLEIAGMILGAGSIALLPFAYPIFGAGAVALAVAGGIVALISYVAYRALDIIVPPHHSMHQHVFQPGTYGVGKLYYQGDIPILELQSDHPYEAGQTHGYLMGQALDQLLNQLNLVKKLAGLPQVDQVPHTIEEVRKKLPLEYVEELEGLVDGFNQWSKEHKWFGAYTLTVGDLILMHLMPDSMHFSLLGVESHRDFESTAQHDGEMPALGCTVVIDQDKEEGLTFGRNMDWPSFGVFGTYSLLINRKYKDEKLSTVELGFPGFVGTLTGMNQVGLSLAMNVCGGNTSQVRGMPAAFFNRFCLENCHNLEEVEEIFQKQPPLGSYHLSVADSSAAKSFHFYQGEEDSHVVREWQVNSPLITTNCKYPSDQEESYHMHCSQERKQIIQDLFEGAQESIAADQIEHAKLVQASLALPFVNNSITAHTIVMYPQSRKIQLAVDNAFAGQAQLHALDGTTLFDRH